jgi:3-oxoacyl-[acyl-carrier protein] reductase
MNESVINKKIALVTGASRGIGASIAVEMARQGFLVIGTATTVKGSEIITQMFGLDKLEGLGLPMDVNSNQSISDLITKINLDHGEISVLVNNAGITRDTLLMRMKEEDWDSVINTNLKSVYKLSQAVIKGMMKKRYGRIINISSIVGHMGNAGQTNYAATKAGISGFTKSLAQEIGSRDVTVNCVAPGFIDTDMTRALSDDQRQQLLGHIPLGRLGTPADVAHAVCYLASDLAGYVTGETIHVNGGMLMI